MRKIGLIGGLSWYSTLEYYQLINHLVNEAFHSNTNPPLWIVNLNQQAIHQLQQTDQWDKIAQIIYDTANQLQSVGCEALALCTNTSHKVVDQIQPTLHIPFLHIADAIGQYIQKHQWHTVGLLGTQFTMTEDFIKGKLNQSYQMKVIVPDLFTQQEIQRRIIEEFSLGVFNNEAKQYFLHEIEKMATEGAQSVILGCTEIPLLLKDCTATLPTIDSLECHAREIVKFILSDS